MERRKLAVNSNCYHGFSIDDAIEGISKAGFKYIELTATKGWTEHVFPNMELKELQRVKDKLEAFNLIPIAMSGHTNLMDKNRLQDFIDNIHLAHFFDVDFIVSSVGEAHLEDKEHASDDVLVENLKTFLPLLKNYNMKLVIEVHGDHGTGMRINEIIQLLNSERFKIAYDTANAIFYGDIDILEDINGCIDNIEYMHIKDKAGEKTEWNFPALGEGYVDIPGVLDLFEDKNNLSPFSIEIEFTAAGPKDLEEVNKAVADSKAYLDSLKRSSL